MGVVYQAFDERLDRRVALKRVLGNDEPRRRERLRREARTAAQLTHPAVVQIHDLLEEDDGDWIVMELVQGKTLAELPRLGIDLILDYGRQIAEGLAAAHQLGIVHRDLKTENVMILEDGRVKILDFGLAKRIDLLSGQGDLTLSEPGQVMGTGRAMSPEQARGLEVAPRSDLFSFGVLLYELATGISPFRGASFLDTLTRVATHQQAPIVELEPQVPRQLSDLVDQLLQKAPELRPASAREVADVLARIAEERRFAARGSTFSAEPSPAATTTRSALEPLPLGVDDSSSSASPEQRRRRLPKRLLAAALAGAALWVFALVIARSGFERRESVTPVAEQPHDPLELYEEGMRAVRRVDRPESVEHARQLFESLLEMDGSSAAAHAGLARAYWARARAPAMRGDPIFDEQAEAVAREAVRLDAYLADAWVSLGLVDLYRNVSDDARQHFETALVLEPANADALYGLGKLAESLGQPEQAEAHLRKAVELLAAPLYLDALGVLLYNRGRYDEAERAFLDSLELASDNVNALRNLSSLYYAEGREDEAASLLQSALKIRPDASLYSNLGTIFFNRGLYPKAVEAFENAIGTAGATNYYIYWLNLADAYRQIAGKEEKAAETYRRAIQLLSEQIEAVPDDVRLLSRRALARARAGAHGEAVADIVRTRELDTDVDVYSRLRLAVAEELCGERDQALASLAQALRSGLALSEARREPDLLALRADPRFHRLLMTLEDAP